MRAHLTHLALALAALCALPACDTAYANTSSTTSSATTQVPSDVIRSSLCAPTVSSVSANSGTELGGTAVTLTGTCFTGSTVAKFNAVNGTSFSVVGPTSITVTTPAYAPALSSTAADNAVAVAVTNPAGTGTLSAGYTYTSKFKTIAGALWHSEFRANDPRITLNSGNVSTWPNFSGTNNLTQGTAANQPAFEATGWNGGASILADGVNDGLKNNSVTGLATSTRPFVFLVIQRVSGTSKQYSALISGTGNNALQLSDSGSQWRITRDDASGASAGNNASTGFDTNKHLIYRGFSTSGTNALVIDSTGTTSTRTGATDEAITQFSILADQNGNVGTNGRAVFMLVYSDEPTSQQITDTVAAIKDSNWAGYTSGSLSLP